MVPRLAALATANILAQRGGLASYDDDVHLSVQLKKTDIAARDA